MLMKANWLYLQAFNAKKFFDFKRQDQTAEINQFPNGKIWRLILSDSFYLSFHLKFYEYFLGFDFCFHFMKDICFLAIKLLFSAQTNIGVTVHDSKGQNLIMTTQTEWNKVKIIDERLNYRVGVESNKWVHKFLVLGCLKNEWWKP